MKVNTLAATLITLASISYASAQEMDMGHHQTQCSNPVNLLTENENITN